jgi:hypothetical protein
VAGQQEARAAARKVLRCPARVVFSDAVSFKARTIDVSMAGISLMLDEPIPLARQCTVNLDATVNGKSVKISVPAKAVYCSVGSAGFRAGMQFAPLSEAVAKQVRQLLQ